jgi:hypothetical protein
MVHGKKYCIILSMLFFLFDLFSVNIFSSKDKIDKKFGNNFHRVIALCKQMDLPLQKKSEYTFGDKMYSRKVFFWVNIIEMQKGIILLNGYELYFKKSKDQFIVTDVKIYERELLKDQEIINLYKSDKFGLALQDMIKFLKEYDILAIDISKIYKGNSFYSYIISTSSGKFLTSNNLIYFENYYKELKSLYVKQFHVKDGVEIDEKYLHYYK